MLSKGMGGVLAGRPGQKILMADEAGSIGGLARSKPIRDYRGGHLAGLAGRFGPAFGQHCDQSLICRPEPPIAAAPLNPVAR